ncbi:MAG: hypothetical protein RL033_6207 [Pseudomonadota bacterium]
MSTKQTFTTETADVLRAAGPPRAKGRRWRWLALAVLAVGGLAAGGIAWERARAPKPPNYVTIPLAKGELVQTVTAVGTLAPVDAVDLGTEVTGRLVRVLVDVNDSVRTGQVMAEIDPEQLEARVRESAAQLESASANMTSARVSLAEARVKAERVAALYQQGLASGDENDTARSALERADAGLAVASAQTTVAKANLASARTQLSRAVIRAPIDGIVLSRAVEAGQTVTAGFQTPVLFTLARDLSKLELSVEVDEADIAKVHEGQGASFNVDAYPGRTFPSRVLKLHNMPKAGATVVTYTALLSVDNEDRSLRPGMTATAAIVSDRLSDVWLVDNAALRFEPPRQAGPRRGLFPVPGLGGPPGAGRRPAGTAAPAAEEGAGDEHVYLADGSGGVRRVSVSVLATDGSKSAIAPRDGEAAGRGPHRPEGPNRPARTAPDGAPPAPPLAEGAQVVVDLAVETPS